MPGNRLLITDLDGTLVGDALALRRFRRWYEHARPELVYASGRSYESMKALAAEEDLPSPRLCICSVGTEIRDWHSGRELEQWRVAARNFSARAVRELLADDPELHLQPDEFQTARKLSYHLWDAPPERLRRLRRRLQAAGLEAELIYSSNRDLDVLPRGMDKGRAAAFVAARLGVGADETLVCGDSGNDLSMFQTGFPGVVVGNAQPELRELRRKNVYHAPSAFADGILDGLRHHFLEQAST